MRIFQRAAIVVMAGALSLSLAVAVSAAPARNGARRGGGTISQAWLSRLNLTADQQAKIQAATDTYRTETQKARSLTDSQERRQATRQARSTYQEAVKAALTPDQQKQLQSMMDEARQYRDLGPVGSQLAGLNLTDDQKAKIKEIVAKYQPEMEKLRASQRGAADRTAVRTQMRDLSQKISDEVKAVLTPDQVKQLQPEGRRLGQAAAK